MVKKLQWEKTSAETNNASLSKELTLLSREKETLKMENAMLSKK